MNTLAHRGEETQYILSKLGGFDLVVVDSANKPMWQVLLVVDPDLSHIRTAQRNKPEGAWLIVNRIAESKHVNLAQIEEMMGQLAEVMILDVGGDALDSIAASVPVCMVRADVM